MHNFRTAFLGVVVVGGLFWNAPADAVTLYSIDINRTSADREAPTFSGSGFIQFDSSGSRPDVFSLTLETIGATFAGSKLVPVRRQFVYDLADLVSADLVAGGTLTGVIDLLDKLSNDGGVRLFETRLNFTSGVASGFCLSAASSQECIFGGGSSTGIRAGLNNPAIVPLPWTLPLFGTALGGLALFALTRSPIAKRRRSLMARA